MENFNIEKYLHGESKSIKDYILLIRNNLKYIFIISPIIISLSVIYILMAKDIYKSSATIKIIKQDENVLENTKQPIDEGYGDKFIKNEIMTITDYSIREKIAEVLIDSFKNTPNKNLFYLVKSADDRGSIGHRPIMELAGLLGGTISADQIQGTDMITISAESPSPLETAIIANTCAIEYQKLNLTMNREKLTNIRKFLEQQREEKFNELKSAEDTLMKFQEKGGIVDLDFQSTGLITQLSQLEAQIEATKIELSTSNEILKQYKFFLSKQDPQLVDYLENQTSQAYISVLQQQLAELQVNKDLALSIKSPNVDISNKIKEFDQRIGELKQKLDAAISSIKTDAFSSNPEQVRELAQKLIEEEIKNNTLSVRLNQLQTMTRGYEANLKTLPKTSTELSQFKRNRETLQQLYLLINDRYQEAMINELSQSGNVIIISQGVVPSSPFKPNRILILLFGLFLGPGLAIGLIIIKNYFDNTVKTPEDIEKNNINFLSWVPQFNNNNKSQDFNLDLVALYEHDLPISESFRAIRARIQHSRIESEFPKLILVTSAAESEGKTFISTNLAGSYAQSGKKTLLIDCDLRRPRIHKIMTGNKKPGLADYLANKVKLDEIIRKTKTNNLFYITSGTLPSNPAEVLESEAMKNFLIEIRDFFDLIILDSAPIIAVIDAEVLSTFADGTVLVISADKTETRLMKDAVNLIKQNNVSFLGTVLNNFEYKSGYGYYYKYYYNYSKSSDKKRRFRGDKINT
jgi:capsular exopolysaccharide synthesis family protein